VTGSLGFVCHSPKIITPSREGKLSYFKVTHYRIISSEAEL
ncbi:hypothetical protein SAMN04488238_1537, partial [Roseicitreum antarcticum]